MTRRLLALVLLLSAALPSMAQSQSTGAPLSGIVLDPDATAVIDAAVVVRNEDNGAIRTTVTDRTGRFALPDLSARPYTIEVAVPVFDIVRRAGVVLPAAVRKRFRSA